MPDLRWFEVGWRSLPAKPSPSSLSPLKTAATSSTSKVPILFGLRSLNTAASSDFTTKFASHLALNSQTRRSFDGRFVFNSLGHRHCHRHSRRSRAFGSAGGIEGEEGGVGTEQLEIERGLFDLVGDAIIARHGFTL